MRSIRSYRLLFAWTVLLLATHPAYAQSPRHVTLQLKWWHQFQFAGFYAAQMKGYYKDAGLDVTIVPGEHGRKEVEEVLSGRADFGVTGSDLVLKYLAGAPVQALGAVMQHSPYTIISPASKHITTPNTLIGKTIMASTDQGWVQLKAILLKSRIDTSFVHVIPHTWNNQDLINGHADAMTGYTSVEANQLEMQGIPVNVLNPVDYGIDFYGDIIFSTQKMVSSNPKLTDRFLTASYKGWQYAMANPHEVAGYILNLPGVKERGVTMEVLLREARKMVPLVMADIVEPGHMSPSRWGHMLDIYHQLGLAPPNPNIGSFLYDRQENSMRTYRQIALYVLLGIVSLFGLILLYSMNLRRAVRNRTAELEREVNRRIAHEAELEQVSRELRISNDELQQFAYLTSHNLRSPVINLVSLQKLIDPTSLAEKNAIYFEKMGYTIRELDKLMEDLGAVLSVRRAPHEEKTELNLRDEMNAVMHLISEDIETSGALITLDFDTVPLVWFSRNVLRNTLLNLVTNALKYRDPQRPLRIRVRSMLSNGIACISVEDNGIGMELSKMNDRLFKMYQRFHPGVEGKGLGLYLVKTQLINAGGDITVTSQPGAGTTFTVYLGKPLQDGEANSISGR